MATLTAHHVGITVADLDACLDFYRDVLGLELLDRFTVSGEAFETVTNVDGATGRFAHLAAGETRVELVEYEPSEGDPESARLEQVGAAHLGLGVEDVDAVVEALPENVERVSEPRTTASGTRLCFLRDPEGNLIEILDA